MGSVAHVPLCTTAMGSAMGDWRDSNEAVGSRGGSTHGGALVRPPCLLGEGEESVTKEENERESPMPPILHGWGEREGKGREGKGVVDVDKKPPTTQLCSCIHRDLQTARQHQPSLSRSCPSPSPFVLCWSATQDQSSRTTTSSSRCGVFVNSTTLVALARSSSPLNPALGTPSWTKEPCSARPRLAQALRIARWKDRVIWISRHFIFLEGNPPPRRPPTHPHTHAGTDANVAGRVPGLSASATATATDAATKPRLHPQHHARPSCALPPHLAAVDLRSGDVLCLEQRSSIVNGYGALEQRPQTLWNCRVPLLTALRRTHNGHHAATISSRGLAGRYLEDQATRHSQCRGSLWHVDG